MSDNVLATSAATRVITLYDDTTDTESTITASPALASLLGFGRDWALRAEPADQAPLSFSSTLAAMVAGPDPLCEWLRGHLALRGASLQSVTKGQRFREAPLPPGRIGTTYSFREALAEARSLAGGATLDVRHFMAAYVVVRDYHREDFLRLRIDRRAWCLELAEVLKSRFPDEVDLWTDFGLRAPAVLLPGFDADLPEGADLLGVGREVEAFAMLIADRKTATPLSIGVFGAWGSGKSYFMARLEERVAALAEAGAKDAYFRRIAQMRFNAWHYSEGNVVASLVDQIVRNLRVGRNDTAEILAERRQQLFAGSTAAEDARRRGEQALAAARETEDQLRAQLDRVTSDIDAEVRRKDEQLAAATAAIGAAQQRLQQTVDDQASAIDAARRAAPARQAAALFTQTMLEDPELNRLEQDVRHAADEARWLGLNARNIGWGVAVAVLTTAAVVTAAAVKETKLFIALTGFIAAIAPIAAKWLTVARDLATRGRAYQTAVRERAQAAVAAIEEQGRRAIADQQADLDRRRAEVDRLRTEIAALAAQPRAAATALADSEDRRRQAAAALQAAAAEAASARQRLDAMTAGSLLGELVGELSATDVFRKELGITASARSAFAQLSDRMAAARAAFESGRDHEPPVLDRIVLYIDDLDRCPAEKVRDVLRAVHLLLAFDLFVCVVAVDPRWVIQCLRDSPGLVINENRVDSDLEVLGGAATPSDYLEKIFQIPLWLRPVPAPQRAPLIAALLGPHLEADAAPPGRDSARPEDGSREAARERPVTGPLAKRAPGIPDVIHVDPREVEFLARVAPLLDGNARALKRFANTYRLVKASLSDVELEYFVDQTPYRLCLAQLAVLATQRRRARALVRLCDAAVGRVRQLDTWLLELDGNEDPLVRSLAADLRGALLPELASLPFDRFAIWLERTRRYSFYL
jgi:KAP family P-loop domain